MWALGLLPEEALEDGFAGPTLGLECAGTVVAVGDGRRRDLQAGDRGDGLRAAAPSPPTSSVPAQAVDAAAARASSFAAAATMPVAFMTAYYALVPSGAAAAEASGC